MKVGDKIQWAYRHHLNSQSSFVNVKEGIVTKITNKKIHVHFKYNKNPSIFTKSYTVKKSNKYLTGHSYASPAHIQYSFTWSKEILEACGYSKENAERFVDLTGGKVITFVESNY